MKDPIKKSKHHDLPHRTLVNGISVVLIALFIFLAEFHPLRWIFAAAVAACSAVTLWEYYQLVKKKEAEPATALGIVAAVLYVFAVFFQSQGPHIGEPFWRFAPVVILGVLLFGCFVYFAIVNKSPILNISTTFFGIIYIAVPLGLLV